MSALTVDISADFEEVLVIRDRQVETSHSPSSVMHGVTLHEGDLGRLIDHLLDTHARLVVSRVLAHDKGFSMIPTPSPSSRKDQIIGAIAALSKELS